MTQKEIVRIENAYGLGKTIFYRPSDSNTWKRCTDKPESWDFEKNCYCVIPHNFKVGDKVRVKDGKDIIDYTANWADSMSAHVGRTFTIETTFEFANGLPACSLRHNNWIWDFRGLEPVEEAENN